MPKKRNPYSRTSIEIQNTGNILLARTIDQILKDYPEVKLNLNNEEHQKDRGIDFQVELIGRLRDDTIDLFKLQVKATEEKVKPLATTENKGKISFQIDNRHIRYYQHEMPWALLFILCDNIKEKVYWYSIQLDDTLEARFNDSVSKGQDSIQIYIDPKNVLSSKTFSRFLTDAKESSTQQFFRTTEENSNTLTASTDFQVDKNKPLLEQLYNTLDYLFEGVNFLPLHLLSQYYPFKVSEVQGAYYHQFKLYTDNEDLVRMLASFHVQENGTIKYLDKSYVQGVKGYQKKVKAILSKLTQNHIYYFISQKNRKEVSVRHFDSGKCDCVACCYSRLEIPQTIQKLQFPSDKSLDDRMKTAYMHYTMGDYLKAAKSFQEIGSQAKSENKKTLFLITQFNLIKLGQLIKNNYYDDPTIQYGKDLMDINLDRIVYQAANRSHHRKLFNYIKEARFYTDSAYEIQTAMSKLRAEYHSFITGGSFRTHTYDQMLNGFAQLSSFLGSNRIIYDRFGEYGLQMEEFTEGIFISLALKETNSHVIKSLNDYHIQRLIFDGNHKVIWRYFNKYHHKSIPYKNEEDGQFFSIIANLLSNHHLIDHAYKAYQPEEGSFWRNPYPEIFHNCLALAAMLEMTDQQAEQIAIDLMACYSKSDLPSPEAYSQTNSFFSNKRSQLSTQLLTELFKSFLSFKDMYLEKRLGIFSAELKTRNQTLNLSKAEFDQLIDYSFHGDRDELRHFNTLSIVYPAADAILKKKLEKKISSQLRKKFDAYNYYPAVISDALTLKDSEFQEKFVGATYPDIKRHSFHESFYGPQDNKYPMFDMFFNLCYKFKLNPEEVTVKPLKGFADYYDWLLDISGYDYTKFKISWISLYPTVFYLREFAKHSILRLHIEEYLSKNRDQKIERLYFDIFNPPRNESEPDYE